MGYYNHRFFILLPFYAFLLQLHLLMRMYSFTYQMEYSTRNAITGMIWIGFSIFCGILFWSYAMLALKGWTIIEAAERFARIARRVSEHFSNT